MANAALPRAPISLPRGLEFGGLEHTGLAVVSLVGCSLLVVMLTLGLLLWDRFAVVARAAASQIRNLDYVAAARAAGCSQFYILTREVLPNIVNPLAVVATLEMALAIL